MTPTPKYFRSPTEWRTWLEKNHTSKDELWVGYYKRGTGKPSLTWPESVDQALCFGWIDGVRKSIDDERYMIRFTPRKPTSIWSAVNIRRIGELQKEGLVREAGLTAFSHRKEEKSRVYSFEQKEPVKLSDNLAAQLARHRKAHAYVEGEAPWYRRAVTHWVMSAKKEETRAKRLAQLIEDSAQGRRIAALSPNKA
ncbi:MAG: bacteriocin-protection protein [Polyangiaceae bacterium]|nr:bacteriocin-protection protein [Polyangiaceae bacterium]